MNSSTKRLPQDQMPPSAVLEPEYAVGKGLITQDEYNAMKNEFFAQSELSVGLILPLILLSAALSYWTELWEQIVLGVAVGAACSLLYLVGVERRFQYRFELKIMILGRWDKAMEAAKNNSDSSNGSNKTSIEEKLSIAVDLNPLTVDFRTGGTGTQPALPTPTLPKDSK